MDELKIHRVKLLDSEQANDICLQLHSLKSSWTKRNQGASNFYTFGRCIYLDMAQDGVSYRDYLKMSEFSNRLLDTYFSFLYKIIFDSAELIIGSKISLASAAAHPGFHIFDRESLSKVGNSLPHLDLQHMRFKWPRKRVSSKVYSFTLPLDLPEAGAGLDIWLNGFGQHTDHPTVYAYKIGELFIQEGLVYHRISNSFSLKQCDRRITLQGHLINQGDFWEAYW